VFSLGGSWRSSISEIARGRFAAVLAAKAVPAG
jgi:hypothetical protein